jgi:hypothetical protein
MRSTFCQSQPPLILTLYLETFACPGDVINNAPRDGDMDMEIAAIGLGFVYLWPGEQELMPKRFDEQLGGRIKYNDREAAWVFCPCGILVNQFNKDTYVGI